MANMSLESGSSSSQSTTRPSAPAQITEIPAEPELVHSTGKSSPTAAKSSDPQPSLEAKVIKFLDEKIHKGLQAVRNMTEQDAVDDVSQDKAKTVTQLLETLEEEEDVQNVYANFKIKKNK